MFLDSNFIIAVNDYQYLLENNYSTKNIIKLVGDHYRLNNVQRSFLYRGITTKQLAIKRVAKLVDEKKLENCEMHIDAYNLFITIHSYLKGRPVFISYDGFLRDAGEFKGMVSKKTGFDRVIELVLQYLITIPCTAFTFYLDEPVVINDDVIRMIKNGLKTYQLKGETMVSKQVDKVLGEMQNGIMVTSDTEIIDQSKQPFFDLAKMVLKYHFNAHFMDLQNVND